MHRTLILSELIVVSSCIGYEKGPPSDFSDPASLVVQGGTYLTNGTGALRTPSSSGGHPRSHTDAPQHNIVPGEALLSSDPCYAIASVGIAGTGECVFGPLGVTGDITGHGSARVDGAVSIGGDVVLDTGANVVLQGGGRIAASVTRPVSSLMAQLQFPSTPCATRASGSWTFVPGYGGDDVMYPLPVFPGETITGWKVFITKGSSLNSMSADLKVHDSLTDTFSTIGQDVNEYRDHIGNEALGVSGLSVTVLPAHTYWITINSDLGSQLDHTHDAEVSVR